MKLLIPSTILVAMTRLSSSTVTNKKFCSSLTIERRLTTSDKKRIIGSFILYKFIIGI